nr:hypothetical protein [uncultured bacterium]
MNQQPDQPIPGDMAYAVECGGCDKTLRAEPGKENHLVCDNCGHEQTYQRSDVQMRQLQM